MNWCGATTKTAAIATVTAVQAVERFAHAVAAATSSAGATHTQWCDQDVGETSSPTAASVTSASGAGARRIAGMASANSPADNSSQVTVRGVPSTPARTSIA